MSAPAQQPEPTAYDVRPRSDELRDLARVVCRVIGIVRAVWDQQGLAPGHPYRFAASMLDCYLKDRYKV